MNNTSCILTVIKNEHEYLDEWIKYHLCLGIQHIFIFEDIDSESHKSITDKYGDMVSLNSIDVVLDDDSKKKALDYKHTKHRSAHILYLKNGLSYIKANYQYEWCFVIDNDEFITFENNTIDDILSSYESYDAFIMHWKCYGANGLINKPNYQDKGVIETYTKEMEGALIGEPYTTKICFKMANYKDGFFFNPHVPVNCKIYDATNTYIRHYITKSLEEYLWKQHSRGYIWGKRRSIDFFFKINPDIKDINLVVLPYMQSGSQGNEIRMALSAWRKFCKFIYHFIVIGEFDEQLVKEYPWVEFIYCQSIEKKEGQYNPHLDIQHKFKVVMEKYSQAFDGFIYMTDDEYAVKPFELDDITRTYCLSMNFNGNEKSPTSFWSHDKWKTKQLLLKENLPTINYTTHYPYYLEFKKLDEIQKKYNMFNESYVFDDVYFNYFKHEKPISVDTIRLGIWNRVIFEREFQKAIDNPNIKFVCNSVEGWSKQLENELWKIIN